MGSIGNREVNKKVLEDRLKGLLEIVDIIEKYNIDYFLAGGALLGIYRDNSFIPWDNDVDIFFKIEDILVIYDDFKSKLNENNFDIKDEALNEKYFSFRAYKYGTRYEFSGFYLNGKYRFNAKPFEMGWKYPKEFFEKSSFIDYRGYRLKTFYNFEKWLDLQYGDWEIPKRKNYLTYKNRTNYFNPIVRLKYQLKKIYKKYNE